MSSRFGARPAPLRRCAAARPVRRRRRERRRAGRSARGGRRLRPDRPRPAAPPTRAAPPARTASSSLDGQRDRLPAEALAPAQHRLPRRADGLAVQRAEVGGAARHRRRGAEKQRWILARFDEQRQRSARLAASRVVWGDGATLAFPRAPLTIVVARREPGNGGPRAAPLDRRRPHALPTSLRRGHAPRLHVALPPTPAERIRDAVQSWLQREARRVFAERAAHFAAARRSRQPPVAVVGEDALGQRQRQRRGAPALAADPASARDHRLRRRPRARAPARDEPRPALLDVVGRWFPTTRRRERACRQEGRADA